MDTGQASAFDELLKAFLTNLKPDQVVREMDRIREKGQDQLHFVWAGAHSLEAPHYFRIEARSRWSNSTILKTTRITPTPSGAILQRISAVTSFFSTSWHSTVANKNHDLAHRPHDFHFDERGFVARQSRTKLGRKVFDRVR